MEVTDFRRHPLCIIYHICMTPTSDYQISLGALQGAQMYGRRLARRRWFGNIHMAAVQNAVTMLFNEMPGPLDRQPPVITRGCLCFLGGNTIVGHFGRCPYRSFYFATVVYFGSKGDGGVLS